LEFAVAWEESILRTALRLAGEAEHWTPKGLNDN
jgi:hypothetical protein